MLGAHPNSVFLAGFQHNLVYKVVFSLLLWPQDLNLSKDLALGLRQQWDTQTDSYLQCLSAAEYLERIELLCLQFLATSMKHGCVKNVQTFKLWDIDSENSAHTRMWNGSNVFVFTTVQCTLWKVFSMSPDVQNVHVCINECKSLIGRLFLVALNEVKSSENTFIYLTWLLV